MPSSRAASALPADAPAGVRDSCLCLHLQRAARAVGRRFDARLRPLELTHEQFGLLMTLAGDEAPAIGALAAMLVLDRTTLTANLKPLQRRGLLDVRPDPADARARRVELTAAGRRLLARALPLWQAAQDETIGSAPAVDAAGLRANLRALAR
jgi:DNA-binding MarR family transcriptional regulator